MTARGLAGSTGALPMDLRTAPASREQGWYLKLMAPNIKGPTYAWLDPSRLYCHPQALHDCVEDLVQPFWNDAIDQVVGIDAMGFILGAAIAVTLQKGFVAIRKVGHLCVETFTQTYRDYSARDKVMEIRTDAIRPGLRVLLVDQWVETGGTMRGAIQLVERQGGVVAGYQIASPEFLQPGPSRGVQTAAPLHPPRGHQVGEQGAGRVLLPSALRTVTAAAGSNPTISGPTACPLT
ncbi:uncharacterized protein LOC103056650 isoform X3 [Python bivittatus]|uniref:adenine phosphoribosyltransferase n=1 Tax=Python bivittatus TaxID=176946 RepID=A0A9F5MXC7_PYTBI|nr:uncharacterized protein LOC103056650 isoform X3 [Python bivittatus]